MLRMLGRHRRYFTDEVLALTGGSAIEWLDFQFTDGITEKQNYGDCESKGLDFLSTSHPARKAWSEWWPQTGNAPNWDAVGVHRIGDENEWLLVEAKGNTEELIQSTAAKSKTVGGGLEDIQLRLAETQAAMSVSPNSPWTKSYYQYANRLAVLHFLTTNDVPARLLFVYFVGDVVRPRANCPPDAKGWSSALAAKTLHLGLTGNSALEKRAHHLFLPVLAEDHCRSFHGEPR